MEGVNLKVGQCTIKSEVSLQRLSSSSLLAFCLEDTAFKICNELVKNVPITPSIFSRFFWNIFNQDLTFYRNKQKISAMLPVVVVPPAPTGSGLSTVIPVFVLMYSWTFLFATSTRSFCLLFCIHAVTLAFSL